MNTPLQMFVMMLAGWVNEQHRAVNAYLKEENRVSVPNSTRVTSASSRADVRESIGP